MLPLQKNYNITSNEIADLLKTHYPNLLQAFYESQSSFLCGIYKRYKSIETANIILCFARSVHLEIIRQREKDLNFNVSLNNFWENFHGINRPNLKITTIVKITGIPKETVRRKIKNLSKIGFLMQDNKAKGYHWKLKEKEKDAFFNIIDYETKSLSVFISKIINNLGMKVDRKKIEKEIQSQFSFYWYHYLSCQLEWLKWWQLKLKDNDLTLIALQATIPTLRYVDKNIGTINSDNVFKIIGQVDKAECNNCAVSATSVSDVTGIPRATCIRKLDKLVSLGFLTRQYATKRYSVNQSYDARTKNILNKDNVSFTIKTFSEYITIILNSLFHNKL